MTSRKSNFLSDRVGIQLFIVLKHKLLSERMFWKSFMPSCCDWRFLFSALCLISSLNTRVMNVLKEEKANVTLTTFCGVLLACLVRFMSHFVNGAVVWYEITKNLEWNEYVQTVGMWLYSFVYNITYLGPETLMTLVAVPVIVTVLGVMKRHAK